MENTKKRLDSTSSSLTNELFGFKESAVPPPPPPPPSPSTGTFSSIFPPPSAVTGRNGFTSELMGSIEKHSVKTQVGNMATSEDLAKNKDGTSYWISNEERRSIFVEKAEPCPLSSSLYYGGLEDMYMLSSKEGSDPDHKKDWGEDDHNENNSHFASRGNWWQGSLYY